eukprot:gene15049-biopygen9689
MLAPKVEHGTIAVHYPPQCHTHARLGRRPAGCWPQHTCHRQSGRPPGASARRAAGLKRRASTVGVGCE